MCSQTNSIQKGSLFQLTLSHSFNPSVSIMSYIDSFTQSEDYRREELIRIIEHSVEKLTLQELEALYYDMSTKNYINDSLGEI